MQSILGYGFLLYAPENYPENEYQEIKSCVENVCRFAEHQCKAANQDNLNFALRVGDKMFITVSVHNGQSEFALFDRENNCLIQKCNIVMLKKYIDQSKMDLLTYRIENECKAIARGSILNRASLDRIWNAKYGEEEKQKRISLSHEHNIGLEHADWKQEDAGMEKEQIIIRKRVKGR